MPNLAPSKFCAGCGHPIVLMMLGKVLKDLKFEDKAVLGLDIGCSLLAWNFLPVNTFQTHHGRVTPTMMGFKKARPESLCFGYTGDGGAYAIGLQSLLYAARRDEPITVFVINNTLYGMTGGQTAPTTLKGQKTDTHPHGYEEEALFGPELLKSVVQEGAYLARTAVNDVKQMQEFIRKAIETQQAGHFSLIEFLSFCPTNWKTIGQGTIAYLENLKQTFKTGEI
ncbi:MAG: thiamine pyrophosphate-dependent enzyme [Patescibacteria group bacterium]